MTIREHQIKRAREAYQRLLEAIATLIPEAIENAIVFNDSDWYGPNKGVFTTDDIKYALRNMARYRAIEGSEELGLHSLTDMIRKCGYKLTTLMVPGGRRIKVWKRVK